jgi:hypothetical protein
MSAPTTSRSLRDAIDVACKLADKKKAVRDTCPKCKKPLALVSLSFRGIVIGKICRFDDYTSFSIGEEVEANQ